MSGKSWVETLEELFDSADQNTLHLIGVGNPTRKDDGVGIQVIMNLKRKCHASPKFCKIHAPSFRIESLISRIDYRKDKALIFDAVEFDASPGSVVLASLKDTKFGYFTTHNIPIRSLPNLSTNLDNVFVLGIQPMDVDVGEGLSAPVGESAEKVIRVLLDLMEARS